MTEPLLHLHRPAVASDGGLPLANGLMGALVWGDGAPLNISLDRTDLWDLREVLEFSATDYRFADVAEKHRAGDHDALIESLERPYYRPGPTKIPAGRIEITLPGARFCSASLDIDDPLATVDLGVGTVAVRVAATAFVGMISIAAPEAQLSLRAPAFGGRPDGWKAPAGFDASHADVWDLGYPPPDIHADDDGEAFLQQGYGGFAFAVALGWRKHSLETTAVWSIATSEETDDPLALARLRVTDAFETGSAGIAEEHRRWWSEYWSRAQVSLPDPAIERQYRLDMYKFGAAARRGAPPISLQGPWTVDNGRLPPWKGDYHHDLNTQMTYWPALTGNQIDADAGFLDWLWDTRDACRAWTRQFFEVDGLNVPMSADLRNRQIGGWRQYTHSLGSSAWLAHHFDQHWRFTRDHEFLAQRAYPYLAEVCTFIDQISRTRDEAGWRSVLLSSSPEIHGNTPAAWFDRLTNYDLTLFRHTLQSAADMADELGLGDEAQHWRRVWGELPSLSIDDETGLDIAPGEPLAESHRHFSHLLAIYPLGDIDPWRTQREANIARQSLALLDQLGTSMWMGYSFAWLACLKARCRDGDGALAALRAFADGFVLPNSFHANGDFANKGYSTAVFRAFTLEGNCAAAQAVHEMLLQSHNGIVRLFPALPTAWHDVGFSGLRAEGDLTITAAVADDRLRNVTIVSGINQLVRVALRGSDVPITIILEAGTPLSLDPETLLGLEGH